MTLSVFLAKLIGLSMIIGGLTFGWRHREMISAMNDLISHRGSFYIIVFFELIGGLALTLSHNLWVADWRVIITIFGWLMLVEAAVHLFLPLEKSQRFIERFNSKNWYVWGGLVLIIIGAYLAGVGFDLI